MRFSTIFSILLASTTAFAGRGSSNAALKDAVSSNSPDAIISELERAEFLSCVSCIDTVAPLIDHQNVRVREAAAWWLERRGVRDDVRDMALKRLQGSDPVLARNGAETLGTFRDASAIPALSAYLGAPLDGASGAEATTALGKIASPAGVAALQQALGAPQQEVRAAAAAALREVRWGSTAPAAAPLLPLLTDASEKVRGQAVYTLGEFRDHAATAPLSAVLTSDASPQVRKHAAWALGQIGDPSALPALEKAKSDADPLVRSMAIAALARLH